MTRKPRIAIMGEFSSGKSTLCNVLMGARPLLEKVTATQLPPVWLSYGPDDAYTMGLDGVAYDAVAFRQGHWADHLPPLVDILYSYERNSYMGRESLQLNVKDIKPSTGQ